MDDERRKWIELCVANLKLHDPTLDDSIAFGIALSFWPPGGLLSHTGAASFFKRGESSLPESGIRAPDEEA